MSDNDGLSFRRQNAASLAKKRKGILFLKRLENDGVKIKLHKQDIDLLNFGQDKEMQEAIQDFDQAVVSDYLGLPVDRKTNNGNKIMTKVIKTITDNSVEGLR